MQTMKFALEVVESQESVTGRNHGIEIPLNAVFTRVFWQGTKGVGPDNAITDVHLTVREIVMFDRACDAVPSGYAARLTLTGVGFDRLESLLKSLPPNCFLCLG